VEQLAHHQINNKSHDLEIYLLVESLTSVENIGMLFRIADAFGVKKIISTHSPADVQSKKVKRISRSTNSIIEYEQQADLGTYIDQLKAASFDVVALEITDESIPIQEYAISKKNKIAIVLGQESSGVRAEVLESCDQAVHINMFGKNSSMNVVNACSVFLWELVRKC